MSFLRRAPGPVARYSSNDPDAPQFGRDDWTGAIKTILKACLVTGYGDKQGAGWAMSDESAHKATFTPTDPQAPPVGITMDSSNSQYSQFDLVWQGVAQGITITSVTRMNRMNISNWSWRLVASARGFAFLPGMKQSGYAPAAGLLYFGALNHNLRDPQRQDFVCVPGFSYQWTAASSLRNLLWGGERSVWSSGDLKIGGNLVDGRNGALWTAIGLAAQRNSGRKWAADAAPMQSRVYADIMVHNNSCLIGKIPGLLVASHRIVNDNDGGIVQIEGSPHRWLWSEQLDNLLSGVGGAGLGLLVNLDKWVY